MRWSEVFESSVLSRGLLFVSVPVLILTAGWLAGRSATSPGIFRGVVVLSLTLHLTIFASLQLYLKKQATSQQLSQRAWRIARAASILCLLPLPYLWMLGFVFCVKLIRPSGQVLQALNRHKEAGRLPLWLHLEGRLQRSWAKLPRKQRGWIALSPVDRTAEPGAARGRLLRLYDIQSYCLGFDAAFLSWALSGTLERDLAWEGWLQGIHRSILSGSLFLFGAGFCIAAAHYALLIFRSPGRLRLLDKHPYAVYLAKNQFTFLAGWAIGREVRTADAAKLAGFLIEAGSTFGVLVIAFLILKSSLPQGHLRRLHWTLPPVLVLVPLLTILVPLLIAWDLLTQAFGLWCLVYPVRALLIGWLLVPWLLRPFGWRDLIQPGLPLRLRALLASLAIPAILPFGGLVVPLWIFMRHRWWPQAKSVWRKKGGVSVYRGGGIAVRAL